MADREDRFNALVNIKGGAGVLANVVLDLENRIAELEAFVTKLATRTVEAANHIAELEADLSGAITDRDEALAAAIALKHVLTAPITPNDMSSAIADAVLIRPLMDRIAKLEAWAHDAMNYIDTPSPNVSPALIVLAGRTLLEKEQ